MSTTDATLPAWLLERKEREAEPLKVGERVTVKSKTGSPVGTVAGFTRSRVLVRLSSGTVIERRLGEVERER